MKKVILLFILFCFLCACNKTSDIKGLDESNADKIIKNNSKISLNIKKYEFYGTEEGLYKEEREKFYREIKERYNIDLRIFGIGVREYNEQLNQNTNLWNVPLENMDYLIKSGQIVSIDKYLKNNKAWRSLPEFIQESQRYNGEIYGISNFKRDFPIFNVRYIKDEWLKTLSLEKPKTINDYYEVMYKFTYNDPDGNKIDDTTGFISYGLGGLADIFRSFNCSVRPLNYGNGYQPTWNPSTRKIEDSLSSEDMEECLEYLHMCYENKVLSEKTFAVEIHEMVNVYTSGKYGSMAYALHFYDDIEKRTGISHSIIVGLEGISKKNIIAANLPCNGVYVLPAIADNKSDIINGFVNIFMSDEYGYFMGKYGVPGNKKGENDFYIEKDTVYITSEIIRDKIKRKMYPSIIEYVPPYNSYEIKYYADGKDYEGVGFSNYDRNEYNRKFYEFSDKIFLEPYEQFSLISKSQSWRDISLTIRELGENTIIDSITGEVSVKDALYYYRKKAKELGLQVIIENVNQSTNSE